MTNTFTFNAILSLEKIQSKLQSFNDQLLPFPVVLFFLEDSKRQRKLYGSQLNLKTSPFSL